MICSASISDVQYKYPSEKHDSHSCLRLEHEDVGQTHEISTFSITTVLESDTVHEPFSERATVIEHVCKKNDVAYSVTIKFRPHEAPNVANTIVSAALPGRHVMDANFPGLVPPVVA